MLYKACSLKNSVHNYIYCLLKRIVMHTSPPSTKIINWHGRKVQKRKEKITARHRTSTEGGAFWDLLVTTPFITKETSSRTSWHAAIYQLPVECILSAKGVDKVREKSEEEERKQAESSKDE